jgi:probable F420-dependent oxidoreductase
LLPAFGLGVADPHEQQAFGVARGDRAAWFDEALPLLRRFWLEDRVDHHGPRFQYDGLRVLPKPVQQPPDVWLGGIAPSELRRVGRLGDGWLPSFTTPAEAKDGWAVINETAAAHERAIDPEHFGVLLGYAMGEPPEEFLALLAKRRPDVDPCEFVSIGLDGLARRIEAFVEAGASKFVVLPFDEPPGREFPAHLAEVAEALLPLQT